MNNARKTFRVPDSLSTPIPDNRPSMENNPLSISADKIPARLYLFKDNFHSRQN